MDANATKKPLFLRMNKTFLLVFLSLTFFACKENNSTTSIKELDRGVEIKYAESFEIRQFESYKTITINRPWPGAEESYTYALVEKGIDLKNENEFDAIVQIPVEKIVVTSTTHIPSLEMLDKIEALVGFPNLNYISSESTRKLIDEGKILELGKNEDINTEVLIDLQPEAVITFAVEGGNKSVATIAKTGIPVLYNADWTETTPLGKAEWIKFFGALLDQDEKAAQIFSEIEERYQKAKEIANKARSQPTVLSGAMYKDIWYLPQGNSWAAQFIKDANGIYLWNETTGTGSLSLNLESVLEKGQLATYWIGPGQFTSLEQLQDSHSVYTKFEAFKTGNIFSFNAKKGKTGGVLYYELAPNRPDLVLQDIIKIIHPELLPDYEPFFFSKLN